MNEHRWTARLETGVTELDLDNRSLLDLVRRVVDTSNEVDLNELKSALKDFQTGMIAHFAREDRLMAECRYEASADHQAEHQKLTQEVQEQINALESFEGNISTISRFMHDWVLQHIASQDMLFGNAILTQQGTTDRRQETDDEFDIFEERRLGNLETIRWTSEIAIGIEAIDSDHRVMINRLNDIIVARSSSDHTRLANLLEQFGNETATHFRNEEALMATFDYQDAERHKEEHRKLLEEYEQQVEDWRGNHISVELLCRFMYRWILHHIAASDIPFGEAFFTRTPMEKS